MKRCCFIGHRDTMYSEELEREIYIIVEELIVEHEIESFIFGSKSKFDDLCWKVVNKLKETYSQIKTVNFYCGNETPTLQPNNLLKYYDFVYQPKIVKMDKNLYVERNRAMIDFSDVVIFYYNDKDKLNYASGTKVAYKYAKSKNKTIINLYK